MLLTAEAAQAQINISGKVFGGARQANVGGHTYVNISAQKHDVIINAVYGGNDIAGTIGSSTKPSGVDDGNHIDGLGSYNSFVRTNKEAMGKHLFIGQLFGGGYGNYTYDNPDNGKFDVTVPNMKVWDENESNFKTQSITFQAVFKPELAKAYVDLHGGTFGYVYGGGDNVTVTANTQICINDSSTERTTSIKDKVMKDGSSNPLELLTTERLQDMGINTEYFNKIDNHIAGVDKFLFSRVFGGNNKADMRIMPSWHLQKGSIENLYSGGNEGRMTSPNGLLLNIGSATETSEINIYNVYGGCRKADVCPESDDGTKVTHVYNIEGYSFPAEFAARTLIRSGKIHNVYGGNDVRGKVYFGNAVGIYTSISGDVYGGGNGSYPYTDNPDLANDLIYGDFYYNPETELTKAGVTVESSDLKSVTALNLIRPNAEQVSIRIAGDKVLKSGGTPGVSADSVVVNTIIGGSVYCGGNSATLQIDPDHAADPSTLRPAISNNYPLVELKIGSYIMIDKVFLGNNGENMVNQSPTGLLAQYHGDVPKTDGTGNVDFSTIDLTLPNVFKKYMEGCAMDIIPSINFDDKEVNHDPADYIDYTAYIGSFYCGGNVGSMTYNDVKTLNFNRKVIIFDKLVGGCNNAIIPAKENVNAYYAGGIIGTPNATTGNKVELSISGLKIEPKRWKVVRKDDDYDTKVLDEHGNVQYVPDANGNRQLEWNTISASTGKETPAVTEAITYDEGKDYKTSDDNDLDRRFNHGHIYGGCYSSGIINGNVVINIDGHIMEREKLFDEVKTDGLGEEESLYGHDQTHQERFKITKRNTGVLLGQQGMDVLGTALNVFGGGKGKATEIWGSTTINLNRGYTFQIYGGSEEGVIGKRQSVSLDDVAIDLGSDVPTGEGDTYKYSYTLKEIGSDVEHNMTKTYQYNPAYSCFVNLKGRNAGVSKKADQSEDMAECEFMYGGGFLGPICGNTYVNLGRGRIFNSFAGSCNADILGHAETYIGRQIKDKYDINIGESDYSMAMYKYIDDATKFREGFPWVRDYTYGGNDLGGQIMRAVDFSDKVSADYITSGTIHKKNVTEVLTANAYTEYLQGRAEGIFGGCYGTYDYTDDKYKDYFYTKTSEGTTPENLGTARAGYSKPYMVNAFVNFRPLIDYPNSNNIVHKVYGAGQGYPGERDRDNLQDRSYVLIDIPQDMTYHSGMEVFGAGAWGGVGMKTFLDPTAIPAASATEKQIADYEKSLDEHSTVIDLVRGQIDAVYGGSYEEGITRRTVVNVPEQSTIKIKNIFGGAYGTKILPPCDVYESHVNYNNTSESARVTGAVFGGNNSERRTLYTEVNISSPVWSDKDKGYLATVYGAGKGLHTWAEYTEVNLLNGAKVFEVYGGSQMGHVLNSESVQKYMQMYKEMPSSEISEGDPDWNDNSRWNTETVDGKVKKLSLKNEWKDDWAADWKKAWSFDGYYTPADDFSNYIDNPYTNLSNTALVRTAEMDDRDYTDLAANNEENNKIKARKQYKYNTNVIINQGAEVVNYAYGGGWGQSSTPLSGDVYGETYIALLGGKVKKDIYAAGTSGSVNDLFGVGARTISNKNGFTASANAYIEGGSCRNVYGGGWEGAVGKHTGVQTTKDGKPYYDMIAGDPADDVPGETHVVIGILKPDDNPDWYGFTKGVPTVMRNAYGGGEGGPVYGTAHVTMNNGYIGYEYNAPENVYVEKIEDETYNLDSDGHFESNSNLYDSGCIFGGGYIDNSSVDFTKVKMYGGHVRNALFGGGEIAAIGRGKINASGPNNSIRTIGELYRPGKTDVELFSGHVHRNVFGGGRGYNNLGHQGTLFSDGYVFGQTGVHIHGGEVGTDAGVAHEYGNVFGGGDIGYVYSAYEMPDGTFRKGVKGGERYDGLYEGYYYEHDWNDNGDYIWYGTERKLTEDCKVLIEPHAKVTDAGGITLTNIVYPMGTTIPDIDLIYLKEHNVTGGYDGNGVVTDAAGVTIASRTYAKGEYVPTYALNTLKNKNTSSDAWEKLDLFGIIIHNAVFAGGNTSPGSSTVYANTTSVFGNATASIHDVYHRDLITLGTAHTGGLYGDGNLTFVDGYRGLNITNYGTDYYSILKEVDLDTYETLPDREKAYYEMRYKCLHNCVDKDGTAYHTASTEGGKDIKASTISAGDLLTLFLTINSDFEYESVTDNDTPILFYDVDKGEWKPNPKYWEENGVLPVYAGRLMNSIQRADFCGVFGSRMVMQGAQDRVPEHVDYTNYTINRVREVSLNKKRSVAGETSGADGYEHGNYFGIYNIVNYLGALTSDVDFGGEDGAGDIRKTDNSDAANYKCAANGKAYEAAGADFYNWKKAFNTERRRNNGNSHNKVALASGVYLELTTEKGTGKDLYEKDWGLITGVVELDLINVSTGIGGGFVYAKNEHGVRSKTGHQNTTLTALNMGAVTRWDFQYTQDDASKKDWQTSGNFVHSTQTIIDDCYNISGKFKTGYNKPDGVPAHYWYIKGSVYVYDQYISAYTGAPNAYSQSVDIPLTITAASHGTMKLLDVMPNKYAYWNSDGQPLASGQKLIINDHEYQLNDPISYWDWFKLANSEQNLFVEDTYIIREDCKIGNTEYAAGHVLLPEQYESLRGNLVYEKLDDGTYDTEPLEDGFNFLVRSSNNMSHNTGYILTYKVNNPTDWDTWYTKADDDSHSKKSTAEYNNEAGYEDGPTYYLTNGEQGGLLGQRNYKESDLISKLVYDTYQSVVENYPGAIPPSDPEASGYDPDLKQAKFERAWLVTEDVDVPVAGGTERHQKTGTAISQTEAAKSEYSGKAAEAYYCTSTIKLSETEYIYLGSRMTLDEKNTYIGNVNNDIKAIVGRDATNINKLSDLSETEQAALTPSKMTELTSLLNLKKDMNDNIVEAYYCTEAGLYGGNYYVGDKNYRALEVFSSMSKEDRDKFTFNYDALDLLIDPDYSKRPTGNIPEGKKYQYDSALETLAGAEANRAGYSLTRPVDYTAEYTGTADLYYLPDGKTDEADKVNAKVDTYKELSRTEFESLTNEQRHYAPIVVNAAGSYYVVNTPFQIGNTLYAVGSTISDEAYRSLGETDRSNVSVFTFTADDLDGALTKTFYYCREEYEAVSPVKSIKVSDNSSYAAGATYAVGATVPVGAVIGSDDIIKEGTTSDVEYYGYSNLPNDQKNFIIHGISPTETSTLFVSRESDIFDLSKEKIITVVYEYDYEETDASGNISPVTERHVVNIHVTFKSGIPTVPDIKAPEIILPGDFVGLREPVPTPGAYEITGGGWELFEKKGDAEKHTNGVEFSPVSDPLYWYQDNWYVAYYAKTYLGKTYSNAVQVKVANYHDLKKVMEDKEHHYYVDNPGVQRDSKVYINDYSKDDTGSKNGLDLLKQLYDLSVFADQTPSIVDKKGIILSGDFKDHHTLDNYVRAGQNLEFILHTDIDHTGSAWTSIGSGTDPCFSGTLHGDGHYLSGLTNSLFDKLCGQVYNLGVKGSFTGAGVAERGEGYVENCWVMTSGTPVKKSDDDSQNHYAVFGDPGRSGDNDLIQMVNCYYPESNDYDVPASDTHGKATQMPDNAFYNGTVAYNLNGFYLHKRFYDGIRLATGKDYSYLKLNADGSLQETMSTGYYPVDYAFYPLDATSDKKLLGYVENRFADGDFRYAGGTIPEDTEERQRTVRIGETMNYVYAPIWPDDYLFFGQSLSYGYENDTKPKRPAHEDVPSSIIRSSGRVLASEAGNRVLRAPAYFRSYEMDVVHFNPYAVFVKSKKDVPAANYEKYKAYENMTAVDLTGYNDRNYAYLEGWNKWSKTSQLTQERNDAGKLSQKDFFFPPLLDDGVIEGGLSGIHIAGLTQNMLVYTNAPGGTGSNETPTASQKTANVVSTYLPDALYDDHEMNPTYHTVEAWDSYANALHGHWVYKTDVGYTSNRDHFLVDKQDFNAPMAYTFQDGKRMWYQRDPANNEYVDRTKGWSAISLPFSAEIVTTDTKGEITHFYNGSYDIFRGDKPQKDGDNSKVGHEYWLREFTGVKTEGDPSITTANFVYPAEPDDGSDILDSKEVTNTFLWDYYYRGLGHHQEDANSDLYQNYEDDASFKQYYSESRTYESYPMLTHALPYIIGFPGATYYEFDLSGKFAAATTDNVKPVLIGKQTITFASPTGTTINVSDDEIADVVENISTINGYTFKPSYLNMSFNAGTDNYTLKPDNGSGISSFDKVPSSGDATPVAAFRPYFVKAATQNHTRSIIFSNDRMEELKGVEEHGDPTKEELSGGLHIWSSKGKIFVKSTLRYTVDLRVVTPAGVTVAAFAVKPDHTVEVRADFSGMYVVHTLDGRYIKKLSVRK